MKLLHTLLVTTILTTGAAAYAAGDHAGDHGSNTPTAATSMSHDGMGHGGEKMEAVDARNTVKLALEPAAALEAGKTTQVTVKLNAA
ncbi:MAG: hypothetical protein AB7U41_02940, partial [Dongiaceae bacterium]